MSAAGHLRRGSFVGRAMGTEVTVSVVGGRAGAAEAGFGQILELEALWSRFRPDSELSQLNRSAGRPMVVSAETAALVEHMVWANGATAGLFDPTVGAALIASGYDRDFAEIAPVRRSTAVPVEPVVAGCGDITVGADLDLVQMPPGVTLDPGGLGKGFAADLVASRLVDEGARSALVDIGGDIRVAGERSEELAWVIATEVPSDSGDRCANGSPLSLTDGGVATSSTLVRRWSNGADEVNHVIDPRTGVCLQRDATVRVVAGAAWWAEVVATALLVDPDEARAVPGLLESVDYEIWRRDV
ncbi:MAG: FAD:protein FMN transferase [Microthrixaceae bacterium]|nr:FAD:protein FMN transferase [Microthrixaceae bacterium]